MNKNIVANEINDCRLEQAFRGNAYGKLGTWFISVGEFRLYG